MPGPYVSRMHARGTALGSCLAEKFMVNTQAVRTLIEPIRELAKFAGPLPSLRGLHGIGIGFVDGGGFVHVGPGFRSFHVP